MTLVRPITDDTDIRSSLASNHPKQKQAGLNFFTTGSIATLNSWMPCVKTAWWKPKAAIKAGHQER